jgi:hypothetical protein
MMPTWPSFGSLVPVDPGVRNVGPHLALEKGLDALGQRHALGVAQLRVGLGVALLITADRGGFVAFGEG